MNGYAPGVHDLGSGCSAWLLPPGGWGQSNSGLVRGSGQSLLVDTHLDLAHTTEMLDGTASLRADHPIRSVVNTHADGDHWFGNQLVAGPEVEIVASAAAAASMTQGTVEELSSLWELEGAVGDYVRRYAGQFDPSGITAAPPTRTFAGELDLDVGGRPVRLVQVGPAHTPGDVLVHVPDAGVVFTGDILFIGSAPLVWQGPVSRCIAACDAVLDLEPDTVVPGHGPVTDRQGVLDVRDYLTHVLAEATRCFEAGLDVDEAVAAIDLARFAGLAEAERIAVNVGNVYEELDPGRPRADRLDQFGRMADLCARSAAPVADGRGAARA